MVVSLLLMGLGIAMALALGVIGTLGCCAWQARRVAGPAAGHPAALPLAGRPG
ncbi:hypothetical protein [Paracraurococcus lichenis]|uniref:Uncharacterized protein n=1 Tax=Paracraurococcus lichenis TaxID=3064888 RepID=A0ABT9EAU9_9PROT|nr:hypothetical protein [Paracraurococcus sp. LOR1-02]MDO9713299.1 hypothetical protein [Paracraurococcus sp. LOR1-02]